MNKENVSRFFKDLKTSVSRRTPEILTGIGIAGMVTTTVLAVKATPKALKLIDEKQRESEDWLTKPEKVKACWKCYIPAATTGIRSISCIISAQSLNSRRTAPTNV